MEVKPRIQKLLDDLNKGVFEKQEIIRLALLSAIAGESIFLLGAPGVAKSLVARRLKFAFNGGSSFEYLMNRFSTPDEIFGPVSIKKLKDDDKYERIVENYLPSATVVFLDEIWKAGPSIQNALLTVLNEKVYRNGDQEIPVPMKALISASNELPMKDDGLDALWDRFLIRYEVKGIEDRSSFNEMISMPLKLDDYTVAEESKIDSTEYEKWSKAIDEIEIPENVFNVIHIIRSYVQEHNQKDENKKNSIYISDRRWKKIVRLLRTSAFLNDRKAVDLMDCFLIAHCIWNEPLQYSAVLQFTKDAIGKHGYQLEIDLKDLRDEIEEFKNDVHTFTNQVRLIQQKVNKIYRIGNENYVRVLGLQGKFQYVENDLLELKQVEIASEKSYKQTTRHRKDFSDKDTVYIAKGKSSHSIVLSTEPREGFDLPMETIDTDKEHTFTKRPHHATKKHWDKQVAKFLTTTSNLKLQIEHYRTNDLVHLRHNLFVNALLAELVETNLYQTQKEIGKLEVEVNSIQDYYENIEDQTEQKVVKQISNGTEQ